MAEPTGWHHIPILETIRSKGLHLRCPLCTQTWIRGFEGR